MESQPQNPEFRNNPENFPSRIYDKYQNLLIWPYYTLAVPNISDTVNTNW